MHAEEKETNEKRCCLLIALILSVLLCSYAFAEDLPVVPGTADVPEAGLHFVPPELFQSTAGRISMDGAVRIADGIDCACWTYSAMTGEEISAWINNHDPDARRNTGFAPSFSFLQSEMA